MVNEKESGSVDSVVTTVIESAKAQLASMSTGVQLALAELRTVISHAGLFVCLVIVAAGMMLVGWGLMLVLGALLLMNLGLSAAVALLCVFLVNTIALVGLGIAIWHTFAHLSFKYTRQALRSDGAELGYMG